MKPQELQQIFEIHSKLNLLANTNYRCNSIKVQARGAPWAGTEEAFWQRIYSSPVEYQGISELFVHSFLRFPLKLDLSVWLVWILSNLEQDWGRQAIIRSFIAHSREYWSMPLWRRAVEYAISFRIIQTCLWLKLYLELL